MHAIAETDPGSTARSPRLSVVVPTYNERQTIERTVDALLAQAPPDTEVIVVDDDSPDRTWQVVERAFASSPRVRVVRRTDERGLGRAILHGFERAAGTYCLVMDADLQHPPSAIPRMVAAAEDGAGVVVGTRYGDGGRIDGWSIPRRVVSRAAVRLAHLLLPSTRPISDPVSGFFLVDATLLERLDLEARGWKLLLDVLVRTDRPVREVGYRFPTRDRGLSKLTVGDCLAYLGHVLALSPASRWALDPVGRRPRTSDHVE